MDALPTKLEAAIARWILPSAVLLVVTATLVVLATPSFPLALLPPLAALGGLALFSRPEWGFLAVVALIPFGAFRGLLLFGLAAGLAAVSLVRGIRQPAPAGHLRTNLWPWLLGFLGWMLISSLASPYRAAAMAEYPAFLFNYAFFALYLYFASERATRQTVPVVLTLGITLGAALAIAGFYLRIPYFVEDNEGFLRGSGGSVSAPALALSILYAVPFLVHWTLTAPRGWMRALAAAAIPVNLVGMVTTYSRGGALVMVFLTGLLTLQHRRLFRPRHVMLLAVFVPLALLLASLLVPPSYWKRQVSLADSDDFSIGRRTTYLRVAREAFAERPIVGYGLEAFRELYAISDEARAFVRKSQEDLRRRAHNTYIEAAIGGGAIGLIFFLGLLGTAAWNLHHACRNARARGDVELGGIAAAYRLAFVGMCVYFLIYSNIDNKYLIFSLPFSWRLLQLSRQPSPNSLP